jgi:lipid-binding SYLF domain-containing protein
MIALGILISTPSGAGLFGPKGKDADEKRANVRLKRDEMLAELYRYKPELQAVVQKAAGYATFSQLNMNLFLLASGNGYGVVVDNSTQRETFMRVASLGGGLGLGVKDLRVVFVFHDPNLMRRLVDEGWQFGGQTDAAMKVQDEGAAAGQAVAVVSDQTGASTDLAAGSGAESSRTRAASYSGLQIYQFIESGVALQATVAGTKYWKDSKLN